MMMMKTGYFLLPVGNQLMRKCLARKLMIKVAFFVIIFF